MGGKLWNDFLLSAFKAKINSIPGRWSTDLNLGITAGVTKRFKKDLGVSSLGGIAISKVILDSISTGAFLKSSRDHVALSPNINLLFSCRNFSIGGGIGLDWVNQDTEEVTKWIYNNTIFYSIAFGINIFRNTNSKDSNHSDQ